LTPETPAVVSNPHVGHEIVLNIPIPRRTPVRHAKQKVWEQSRHIGRWACTLRPNRLLHKLQVNIFFRITSSTSERPVSFIANHAVSEVLLSLCLSVYGLSVVLCFVFKRTLWVQNLAIQVNYPQKKRVRVRYYTARLHCTGPDFTLALTMHSHSHSMH
jgi:hypothetical protein